MKKIIKIMLAVILVMILPLVTALDKGTAGELSAIEVINKAKLMEKIPETYELAEKEISVLPVQKRFLLYTNNGKHIMWGKLSQGYFKGQDNLNKKVWGIYGKVVFAGFYDGRFFWGRYRGGNWVAYGLFNMRSSRGKFVIFPHITPRLATAQVVKMSESN